MDTQPFNQRARREGGRKGEGSTRGRGREAKRERGRGGDNNRNLLPLLIPTAISHFMVRSMSRAEGNHSWTMS